MATVLTDTGTFDVPGAEVSDESLWIPAPESESLTGWALAPQGLCRGEVCVPLPAGREHDLVREGRVNLAALWRHLGQPVLHSDRGHVWVLGTSARDRAAALASLEAPDFSLPDPSGRLHSLLQHRGQKVLLVTWASW